ncbi:MAG: zf-HC2 domain-containing protein [Alphaproteobacteria bacterium]|nr:zf-HC2 domain-containing protein [Alphaproteobacteria bacterium]MCB9699828.1 zf-HC2 domain-containing protein [Alphaproteobacteria bacterium]
MTHEGERRVSGLWCSEVLARLPDYVEGTLSAVDLAAVEGHVGGCDWCERFGGAYAGVVRGLRRVSVDEVPDPIAERLAARLAEELG